MAFRKSKERGGFHLLLQSLVEKKLQLVHQPLNNLLQPINYFASTNQKSSDI